MIPPCLLYFSFPKMNFGIWFPVFIFWPVGLLIFLLILPFWILATICLIWIPEYRRVLIAPVYIHNIICSLRGLIIEIQDKKTDLSIKFI